MITKVIKSRAEYEAVLSEIGQLIDRDPAPGTADGERLDLLTLLARDYESRTLSEPIGDPLESIRFRMEQQGLNQRDLVPYIGSRSKVSEVLSGKRALSLAMIRALHSGLGIPAKALLAQRDPALLEPPNFEWEKFPLKEMVARGWIRATAAEIRSKGEELLRSFLAPVGNLETAPVHYRQTGHVRSGRQVDRYALTAWTARILRRAAASETRTRYQAGTVTLDLMREIARLSWSEQGPRLAQEFLAQRGISVIIEPHLPGTHLDGAAIQGPIGPVIGLTVRHDRLDNFWFCLMHELTHVAKHLRAEAPSFYDDLDAEPSDDIREREADEVAREALIPHDSWMASPARSLHSSEAVHDLATELRIHPAIVAGRIRHEFRRFRVLGGMVGHGEVRRVFDDVRWPEG